MTRKEVVQTKLDFLNSVLGSAVIGGVIGLILLIIQVNQSLQSLSNAWILVAGSMVGLFFVGCLCNYYRNKLLLELNDMP